MTRYTSLILTASSHPKGSLLSWECGLASYPGLPRNLQIIACLIPRCSAIMSRSLAGLLRGCMPHWKQTWSGASLLFVPRPTTCTPLTICILVAWSSAFSSVTILEMINSYVTTSLMVFMTPITQKCQPNATNTETVHRFDGCGGGQRSGYRFTGEVVHSSAAHTGSKMRGKNWPAIFSPCTLEKHNDIINNHNYVPTPLVKNLAAPIMQSHKCFGCTCD